MTLKDALDVVRAYRPASWYDGPIALRSAAACLLSNGWRPGVEHDPEGRAMMRAHALAALHLLDRADVLERSE